MGVFLNKRLYSQILLQ